MRSLLTVAWLVIPVALLAYHYGPGQEKLARDRAARELKVAEAAEAKDDWKAAHAAYGRALQNLPEKDSEARLKARLAQSKTRMYFGELPEAAEEVDALLADAHKDAASQALKDEIRSTAGSMRYYLGWLMRLEGAETEEWTEQTEAARQEFRLLAEQSQARGDAGAAKGHQENLEASIRLARMDISELKGLPLPKQCQGNGDCAGKCRKQKESRSKVGKKPGDARQQITEDKSKGAGKNDRPEGGS